MSPVSSGSRGSTPAEGRAGRRETSSTTAGTRARGDRAGAARGKEGGDRPGPLRPSCLQRGSGFAPGSDVPGRRGAEGAAAGHTASVPSAERQGSVRASGTQLAAGPSCTQWGRGWPSRRSSTVRALRQRAQCPRRGGCCGAASASGHSEGRCGQSRHPQPPDSSRPRRSSLPTRQSVPKDTGFGPDSEARLKTGSGGLGSLESGVHVLKGSFQ